MSAARDASKKVEITLQLSMHTYFTKLKKKSVKLKLFYSEVAQLLQI